MMPEALVAHSDPSRLRFACEALTMFRPGFRVATATDLASASEWLEATDPLLVVWDPVIESADAITAWWDANQLGRKATVAMGDCPDDVPAASAIVPAPVALPEFMEAVRSAITAQSVVEKVGHVPGGQET